MEAAAKSAGGSHGRAKQIATLAAFYERHDGSKTLELIEGIVDKRRGNADCLGAASWAALSAVMGAKYGEALPALMALGASSSSSGGGGKSSGGGGHKGVAGGAIGKATRRSRAPSTTWASQDLGIISSLIAQHLERSEGNGGGEGGAGAAAAGAAAQAVAAVATSGAAQAAAVAAAAASQAAVAPAAAAVAPATAAASASGSGGDARVAVVLDELAMTIADQALGGASLEDID